MRRLIVNADDFGLTSGINRAVGVLHVAGALTSTTLMAAAPCFDEASGMAGEHRSLGVGCHIVLLDGMPVAEPQSVPTLLAGAEFRTTLGSFVSDLALGRIRPVDIEREAAAQIRRLQQAGIAVTHVDTHKHTHMFPSVLSPVLRAAAACGIRAIRNPFEPEWSTRATPAASVLRRSQVRLLRVLRRNFCKKVREHGLVTTDGCIGIAATGTLDGPTLRSLVRAMPKGTWELVCHPAYVDDELRATRTRLQDSRAVELQALSSLPATLEGAVQRIHFGRL